MKWSNVTVGPEKDCRVAPLWRFAFTARCEHDRKEGVDVEVLLRQAHLTSREFDGQKDLFFHIGLTWRRTRNGTHGHSPSSARCHATLALREE